MKTYDHQKYFPKALHKNFTLMVRVKLFLFPNFLTVEYYNPRKLRLTKIKIDGISALKIFHNMSKLRKIFFLRVEGGNFPGGNFLGGQFSGGDFSWGAIFLGGNFAKGIFPRSIFSRTFILSQRFF